MKVTSHTRSATCVEIGGHFHVEGLMRAVLVNARDEGVEARLLLKHIGGGGLSRFAFQRQVHALVPAVLLGMARSEALDGNS